MQLKYSKVQYCSIIKHIESQIKALIGCVVDKSFVDCVVDKNGKLKGTISSYFAHKKLPMY